MMSDVELMRRERHLKGLALNTYSEYSLLPWIINLNQATENSLLRFEKFAFTVRVGYWNDFSYIHDPVFYDLARSVGLSERKYIMEKLEEGTTPHATELNLQVVTEHIREMVADRYPPTVIALPIELHHAVNLEWDPTWQAIQFNPDRLRIDDMDVRILWSNKYMPFKRAYLVNRDFGVWTTKEPKDRRLEVVFRRVTEELMEVTVQTVFNFQFLETGAVRSFEILNLPPDNGM